MIDIPDFVYPKDPDGNALCPKCRKLVAQCDCPSFEPVKKEFPLIKPSIRLDRAGRNGKIVTMIENLPHSEAYLKNLTKRLKVKTGCGGTFYLTENGGTLQLQGDHKKEVIDFLKSSH
jgi:translation initiation factor 1